MRRTNPMLLTLACALAACGGAAASTPAETTPVASTPAASTPTAAPEASADCASVVHGFAPESGPGSDGDPATIATLLEQACQVAETLACARLGRLYDTGCGGLPHDPSRALERYTHGNPYWSDEERIGVARAVAMAPGLCEGGDAAACSYAGDAQTDPSARASFYQRAASLRAAACTAGTGAACETRMNDFEYGNGGETQDEAQAQAWAARAFAAYQSACTAGDGQGCLDLSTLCSRGFCASVAGGDLDSGAQEALVQRGLSLLRASCASGEPAGCGRLGRAMALHGSQQGQDHEEQMAAFRRGCDLHDEDACVGWRQFTSVTP